MTDWGVTHQLHTAVVLFTYLLRHLVTHHVCRHSATSSLRLSATRTPQLRHPTASPLRHSATPPLRHSATPPLRHRLKLFLATVGRWSFVGRWSLVVRSLVVGRWCRFVLNSQQPLTHSKANVAPPPHPPPLTKRRIFFIPPPKFQIS